jgi:Domain of unknown function (DUF4279)
LIKHPTLDPDEITKNLVISPTHSWKNGDPRMAPNGARLPGNYPGSCWTLSFDNIENTPISELIKSVVTMIPRNLVFWSSFSKTGGEAELILALVGTKYQGASIDVADLQSLATLGISLGLEIYSEPQN